MSSKRGQRRNACTGKRRYTDGATAGRHSNAARRSGDLRMQAYHCPFCGGWHIGHAMRTIHGDGLRGRRRP